MILLGLRYTKQPTKKEIVIKVRKKYNFIFFYTHVDTHFFSMWTRRLTWKINDW